VKATFSKLPHSKQVQECIHYLQNSQEEIQDKVEALYASLNVHKAFPELDGINFEFIWMLLMACDLKINIRKCAIGTFFEFEKLDQAAAGRNNPLGKFLLCSFNFLAQFRDAGTKIHQETRKAIADRAPALMTAIKKFNRYCELLAELHDDEWGIPLPEPLPLKLDALRSGSLLMEDVWISRSPGTIPAWLENPNIQAGIRAMPQLDHCVEERWRLSVEVDNLCRWFGHELRATEIAIVLPHSKLILVMAILTAHSSCRSNHPLISAQS